MKIVADENIAQVAGVFAAAGELCLLPGRAIDAAAVRDADAVLVRSVTRVDADLLAGSRCRFVGTATSGVDHVDSAWLRQQEIAFAAAPGCNADSVVDYVFSALAWLSREQDFDWRTRSFGIVGCGQIGSRLARKLLALDIPFAIYDPGLDANHPLSAHFAAYETALRQDVVSFHTPLTRNGPWPTWHMLAAKGLERMQPTGILLNAARGGVVDNVALLDMLQRQPEYCAVLDAWEGEPLISQELLKRVTLGTAHIAGYSYEGKLNGTRMLAAAFNAHFGMDLARPGAEEPGGELQLEAGLPELAQLNQLILQAYDIARDDVALRATLGTESAAAGFDLLRKHYPLRREFSAHSVNSSTLAPRVAAQARALGFHLR